MIHSTSKPDVLTTFSIASHIVAINDANCQHFPCLTFTCIGTETLNPLPFQHMYFPEIGIGAIKWNQQLNLRHIFRQQLKGLNAFVIYVAFS